MRSSAWLLAAGFVFILLAFAIRVAIAGAQEAPAAVRGYTTADPINADRFGIAVPGGRYMVQLTAPCEGVSIGQNLWVWQDAPDAWRLQPLESADQCAVVVFGRMDNTPCFGPADGPCDVAYDPPYSDGY